MKPLEKAVEIIAGGNKKKFSEIVSQISDKPLSQQLVDRWFNKTNCVCSPGFAPYIESLTNGEVTKEMLRPDIFFEIPKGEAA